MHEAYILESQIRICINIVKTNIGIIIIYYFS
jgi:hypothetical protein